MLRSVPCRWDFKVELSIKESTTTTTITYDIDKTGGKLNILVFNLSGNTFDVILLTVNNNVSEVHTTNCDTHQGGKKFGQRVMQNFTKMTKMKSNTDIRQNNVVRVEYTLLSQH